MLFFKIGTIAGNLMTKHRYREFPSDIFLILETIGAKLVLANSSTDVKPVDVQSFLDQDMNKRVLLTVSLPALDCDTFVLCTYKVR